MGNVIEVNLGGCGDGVVSTVTLGKANVDAAIGTGSVSYKPVCSFVVVSWVSGKAGWGVNRTVDDNGAWLF